MNGILLVDKPSGWTSNDVVCKLKGVLHERRVGHSGTLDPMATGLLVVFAGRATRAVQFAESHSKKYTAALHAGVTTDTYDVTGKITGGSSPEFSLETLDECLNKFTGDISQLPPMYSAVKINGKKLYELARKGIDTQRSPRMVRINSLTCTGKDSAGDYILDVDCSKGTYIRSLINDIGENLGCGACMSSLRRTSCGCFNITQAVKLEKLIELTAEEIEENYLLPVDSLFSDYRKYIASETEERLIRCGNSFPTLLDKGTYRVYSSSGEFLMLGESNEGKLITIKSFFEV